MTLSTPVERLRRPARRAVLPISVGILAIATALSALGAAPAGADAIEAVPSNWRLQDYGPAGLSLWFTGAPCPGGHLMLPSTAGYSPDRLWATVMTAKVTNRPFGIFYHVDNGACMIDSFFLQGSG